MDRSEIASELGNQVGVWHQVMLVVLGGKNGESDLMRARMVEKRGSSVQQKRALWVAGHHGKAEAAFAVEGRRRRGKFGEKDRRVTATIPLLYRPGAAGKGPGEVEAAVKTLLAAEIDPSHH